MSLWITYAWKDNDEGNFDYLVQELTDYGIDTKFDKVAIVPGQHLWTQIADNINDPNTKAWAYLITPNSLASKPCLEELMYALNRALQTKEASFPLIGLLSHGVSFEDIPTALKVRLCVSLANPNWKEQIKAGLEMRPVRQLDNPQTKYIYSLSQQYNGTGITTTIEIRPRFGEVHNWRIAVPMSTNIIRFGYGAANSGQTAGITNARIEGTLNDFNGQQCKLVGAGNALTPGTSAYIFIESGVPDFIGFGFSNQPMGMPIEMELQKLKD